MVDTERTARELAATIASRDLLCALKAAVDEVFATMLSTLGVGVGLGDACSLDVSRSTASRDGSPRSKAVTVEARVDIRGPLQGWICLSCTAEAADDLARGLLRIGHAEVLSNAEVEDALGECANMIAGGLKTGILDPRGSFSIGIPTRSTRQDERACPSGMLAYRVCAGTLQAELWLEQAA